VTPNSSTSRVNIHILKVFKYRRDGHSGIAKHPGAAALAGDAFHGWALRPIESGHGSSLLLSRITRWFEERKHGYGRATRATRSTADHDPERRGHDPERRGHDPERRGYWV
jgi:hypothetical protein